MSSVWTAIYPGYYTGRAVHIHAKVHPEWQVHPNGTFTPARLVHSGQFFFDENVNIEVDKVLTLEPLLYPVFKECRKLMDPSA